MAKEYRTFVYDDDPKGQQEMAADMNRLAAEGWEVKIKEATQQGWDPGKTCCLGVIFLPLALLGKKSNSIQVIFERESDSVKNKRPHG